MNALPSQWQSWWPQPAFSVLVTGAQLTGRTPTAEDWAVRFPARYPPIERIRAILEAVPPGAIAALSYVPDDEARLAAEIEQLRQATGFTPHAMQLNQLVDPDPEQVATVCELLRDGVVIQLSPALYDACRPSPDEPASPERLVARIRPLVEAGVKRALYDRSCGAGEFPTDLGDVTTVLGALRSAFPGLGLGIAGGLSAETIGDLPRFPGVSVDAEGRLRDADDELDVSRVVRYVLAAVQAPALRDTHS